MTKLTSLVIALAVGQVAGLALSPAQLNSLDRRQAKGKSAAKGTTKSATSSQDEPKSNFGIGQLLSMSLTGKLGHYMGEPDATAGLTNVAKSLGANRNAAGGLGGLTATTLNAGFGPVAAPAGAAPKTVDMKVRVKTPGAKTIKIRYGPYKIPSSAKKNALGEGGMLSNYPATNLQKPCTGECTIIGMEAGLEYVNGTNANIDSGLWLHHMVLFNVGPGREDHTCSHRDVSVPHATIGATPRNSERIFASGNERTPAILPDWGVTDAGYKLKAADKFAALIELMNENPSDQVVWLTMTYDIVDGHPFKDHVKVVWFDVRQCGTSEVNPPVGKNQFVLDYTWKTTIDSEVVGAIEHLHDGGTRMTVGLNGKDICDSEALYGTKPEFVSKPSSGGGGHSHGGAGMKHISEQKVCFGNTLAEKTMKVGQSWDVKAYYDFDRFEGASHDGVLKDKVMGITIMFVRVKG